MERNRRGRPRHPDVLTPAEWRVLEALREGGTNAEIAARLGLSLDTVKYHISNMLAKLDLRDRRALASWRAEERPGRLGALFTVPAAVWAVARPIAWVGAGTAAVAGAVVGVVAVVALVAVVLVAAGGDADAPLAVAPPPTQTATPAPTPTATASPTPQPSPTPVPTVTATPSPTPSATPSPTSTRTPTATPAPSVATTPSPTPTATPTPAPTPAIATLPTRAELGIWEVDGAVGLAHAGFAHVRYETGEEVPWVPGLYLLDVESGSVEGWTCRHGCWTTLSASNRFLLAGSPGPGAPLAVSGSLLDRETGRAYEWDNATLQVLGQRPWTRSVPAPSAGFRIEDAHGFIFRREPDGPYVVTNDSLEPITQFDLARGQAGALWARPSGSSLVAYRDDSTLHFFDLSQPRNPTIDPVAVVTLPHIQVHAVHPIEAFEWGVAVLQAVGARCRIIRFDWSGSKLSDAFLPIRGCSTATLSPNGNLIAAITKDAAFEREFRHVGLAISIYETASGVESHRIVGAAQPELTEVDYLGWGATGAAWLSDSSGVVIGTKYGDRVAYLDGRWGSTGGWPARHDARLFANPVTRAGGAQVTDGTGNVLATFDPGPPVRPVGDAIPVQLLSWGAGPELRVELYASHPGRDWPGWSAPPLAPVIEQAPFGDRLLVEVVVGTCLNIRFEASLAAPIVACLPNGSVAETDDYEWWDWLSEEPWMHIRTDDGVEGWAHADYLRWHSDGVRLEE